MSSLFTFQVYSSDSNLLFEEIMNLSKKSSAIIRLISRLQQFGKASNLFWRGMDDNVRVLSAFCIFVALVSFSLIVWSLFASATIKEINLYTFIKYCGPVFLLFGTFSWLLIGPRLRSAIRGEYFKCKFCNVSFEGCQNIEEAFRIHGKLGNIPEELTATVVCQNGHTNPINWDNAMTVMRGRLSYFKDLSSSNKERFRNQNNHKYAIESEFEGNCSILLNANDPSSYLYEDINNLKSSLNLRFANRPWPSNKRENLYFLLASLAAYSKLADDAILLTKVSSLHRNISVNRSIQIRRVILASPDDVKVERDIVKNVIERINRNIGNQYNIRLELIRWEDNAYPGFHEDGANEHIKSIIRIDESDIFVGILWKKFGTPTSSHLSGTEDEFNYAYNLWKKNKVPAIFFYFCQKSFTATSGKESEQMQQVLQFKEKFPKEGLWWTYSSDSNFEREIYDHLQAHILGEINSR